MHRLIRDHLEEVIAGLQSAPVEKHLSECDECRDEVTGMREHAALLQVLRTPPAVEVSIEQRPGFYARVMDRIEAQTPASIWRGFFESAFGRRIAIASLALAVLFGVYMVTSEQTDQIVTATQTNQVLAGPIPGEDEPGLVLAPAGTPGGQPDDDAVLANLVTYQEQ